LGLVWWAGGVTPGAEKVARERKADLSGSSRFQGRGSYGTAKAVPLSKTRSFRILCNEVACATTSLSMTPRASGVKCGDSSLRSE
jgi:hypothetical protein